MKPGTPLFSSTESLSSNSEGPIEGGRAAKPASASAFQRSPKTNNKDAGRCGDLLVSRGISAAVSFEQEPGTTLCFVDPNLNHACRGDVASVFAHVVRFPEPRGQD